MAKVLFIQNFAVEYLGVMYLSSHLKKHGHNTAVVIGKDYRREIRQKVKKEKPDIVGISIMTFSQDWGFWVAKSIKRDCPQTKIVFGGPHPTYFHDFINEDYVDTMIVGEAESAFLEVIDAFGNNESVSKIKNVHCKENGKYYRNSIRPVIKNLDEIAFPDRELYIPYSLKVGRKDMQSIITSRGCPFKCTYCYNNAVDDYYGNEIRFVRTRSIENVINELIEIKEIIKPRKIIFHDDFLGLAGKKWIHPFLEAYRDKVGLPFISAMRADTIANDPDLSKLLKEAGCFQVCFGIESGNERIRNDIIKKNLKDKDIIEASDRLHNFGIYIRTCNLLGVPGETIENVYETIALNQKIKADFPHPYIFFPYPKTELARIAMDKGLLSKEYYSDDSGKSAVSSFHDGSILDIDYKEEIKNLHRLFQLMVSFPRIVPFIKKWSKKNHPKINYIIFKIMLWYKFKRVYKLSFVRSVANLFR